MYFKYVIVPCWLQFSATFYFSRGPHLLYTKIFSPRIWINLKNDPENVKNCGILRIRRTLPCLLLVVTMSDNKPAMCDHRVSPLFHHQIMLIRPQQALPLARNDFNLYLLMFNILFIFLQNIRDTCIINPIDPNPAISAHAVFPQFGHIRPKNGRFSKNVHIFPN